MFKLFHNHPYKTASVKVYHGYGHTHNLVLYGHVFKRRARVRQKLSRRVFPNIIDLLRMFIVTPMPGAKVQLNWYGQVIEGETDEDGFFKLEWQSRQNVPAGWHPVNVALLDAKGIITTTGEGGVYVPHVTQYAFISDIDDTVMVSHSASSLKKLVELSFKNPHRRGIFDGVAQHYKLLSVTYTTPAMANPFFYVSSSEWNLYDYLNLFFTFNHLPKGAFLLNPLKRWYQLAKTGKTEHEGKLLRIVRILEAFPRQQFILFGDNSQQDPAIYTTIAQKYAGRILAIYIRNIRPSKEMATKQLLAEAEKNAVHTCLYKDSNNAILHSKTIGLL